NCLLTTLRSLKREDLEKTVLIRGEPHSVPLALERSLGHTCYHIGQIVQVARIHAGEKWNTLTIPRGGSEQFNKANWGQTGKSHSWSQGGVGAPREGRQEGEKKRNRKSSAPPRSTGGRHAARRKDTPKVGPAIAADLRRLGITLPSEL